jgi:hypothetical protein
VSKGLGATQLRMLGLLEEHHAALGPNATGLTIDELGRRLSTTERRTRAVVSSLVDRDLATVVAEGGPQRVWGHAARRRYVSDQAYAASLVASSRRPPREEVHCPSCGAWVQTRPPSRW